MCHCCVASVKSGVQIENAVWRSGCLLYCVSYSVNTQKVPVHRTPPSVWQLRLEQ